MDDLPELPFEKVLSYLSLEDRLKARAVSRRWYHLINSFKVKSLCYSQRPTGFIVGKSRWISDAYAKNFIRSTRFSSFFNTFGPTILSNLKHLRICDLHLKAEDNGASPFVLTLNMFGQLEELDLINFTHPIASGLDVVVKLNLLMLTSIHLQEVKGIDQLILDVPRSKKVKLLNCSHSLKLKLVHADSVEWLATDKVAHVEVKNLKSLKYLHCKYLSEIDATFLSSLEKLKEVHTLKQDCLSELFEQEQRYGRTDLKIFLCGFLLNGPDDPAIDSFYGFKESFVHLVENPSRLADEIPFLDDIPYTALGDVSPVLAINVLSKFTDLAMIAIESSIPVQDVQRFLNLLKNLPNIVFLQFSDDQPQDLFDRLPEHCAVQFLTIQCPVSDFRFLYRLKHLLMLKYRDQIDAKVIRKAFKELQFLTIFYFKHLDKLFLIIRSTLNGWAVSVDEVDTNVADLNAAIQLVFEEKQGW